MEKQYFYYTEAIFIEYETQPFSKKTTLHAETIRNKVDECIQVYAEKGLRVKSVSHSWQNAIGISVIIVFEGYEFVEFEDENEDEDEDETEAKN